MWSTITPQLPVADVAKAQKWFREVLDFEITYTGGESFGAVRNGNSEIFLAKAERPWSSVCCCVRVDDADFVYSLCRERGAKLVSPISDKPWRMREFTLEDPNGHLFRIGRSLR